MVKFDENRLTKVIFNMDYRLCRNNWCSELKDVLNKLDLITYYDNTTTINMKTVKDQIHLYYSSIWVDSVQNVPKLRTYIKFKTEFRTESYAMFNLTKCERSMLAQFRCGILPLRIETGRYIGEHPEERLVICAKQIQLKMKLIF